jgi:hypothetical protein
MSQQLLASRGGLSSMELVCLYSVNILNLIGLLISEICPMWDMLLIFYNISAISFGRF